MWKSADDGETWTDETGDLVTISPGPGVWFEKDYYQVTRGEGLTVKRNFELGGFPRTTPHSVVQPLSVIYDLNDLILF